jgi:ferritin-like metal-binding protein YciE
MKLRTMDDLFLDSLRDLYDAEKQITKALPKMSKAATSDELKAAFEQHLQVTRRQVERLDQIFTQLDEKPTGKKCAAMAGLIEEGEELIKEGKPSPILDAGLIGAAQKVEHYEMAGYGTARTFANLLGHTQAAQLLQDTLEEEKETDQQLTELAESVVNEEAAQQEVE